MATITDVAKEADVSLATVSRVINKSFMVSQEKRERVLIAMEKLGYHQTVKAKETKHDASGLILVITSIYHSGLFDSLQRTAQELGYNVIFNHIFDHEDGWESSMDILKILQNNFITGIITVNAVYKNDSIREIIKQYPVVQIGEPLDLPENYMVTVDDVQAAYDITKHLISLNKKRIALMTIKHETPQRSMSFVSNRELGFLKALNDHDIPFDQNLKFFSDYTVDGGAYAAYGILKTEEKPDAIFCITDIMALGCINTFIQNGIKMPQDIAVCGFDNMEFSEFIYPSLTTIDQSFPEIGAEATRMLHSLVNREICKGRKLYVNHQLIIRNSTDLEYKFTEK